MIKTRIILIDDDKTLCDGVAFILQDEGYSVMNTSDPDAGMELIEKHVFDIALLDYKMPRLTGVDFLKKIKEKNPATKVFIVSGRPFIEKVLAEENVSHLVEGIIKKPFKEETLLEAVKGAAAGKKEGTVE
ncbi:MAG TPA: hypothetical protein DET40_25965 [Lentisphaeria bacterium]|nr:MAG: hypothetical protein A2X45_15060 [Lentisphaerae bacterium GWF2_50_93]HCE47009.1 hypothetical protein [Lentisphaeria bacterium]